MCDVQAETLKRIEDHVGSQADFFADKKVLVTGGAGFLGSWLCDALWRFGASVICIDDLSAGSRQNIVHLEHARPENNQQTFRFILHDVVEKITPRLAKDVDLVFHLASLASPFIFSRFPLKILKTNILGALNLLELTRGSQIRFIFSSTSEIYGDPAPDAVPTPETYRGNVSSTGLRSCYDEGKRAAEAIIKAWEREHGGDHRIARIFNTSGPRIKAGSTYGRVIPNFILQSLREEPITVFGDGTQTRTIAYVSDTIGGLLLLAAHPEAKGEIVNIGGAEEHSVLELATLIKQLTGSSSPITFHPLPADDPRRRQPDISKAKALLGWKPATPLQEGLELTIRWFKDHHERLRPEPSA